MVLYFCPWKAIYICVCTSPPYPMNHLRDLFLEKQVSLIICASLPVAPPNLLLLPVRTHFIAKTVFSDANSGLLFIKHSCSLQIAPSWLSVHCSCVVVFLFLLLQRLLQWILCFARSSRLKGHSICDVCVLYQPDWGRSEILSISMILFPLSVNLCVPPYTLQDKDQTLLLHPDPSWSSSHQSFHHTGPHSFCSI